jgi:hypothetical protein
MSIPRPTGPVPLEAGELDRTQAALNAPRYIPRWLQKQLADLPQCSGADCQQGRHCRTPQACERHTDDEDLPPYPIGIVMLCRWFW